MRGTTFWIAALLFLQIAPQAFAQRGRGPGRSGSEFGWLNDYRLAKETARTAKKPIMLVFRCVP